MGESWAMSLMLIKGPCKLIKRSFWESKLIYPSTSPFAEEDTILQRMESEAGFRFGMRDFRFFALCVESLGKMKSTVIQVWQRRWGIGNMESG